MRNPEADENNLQLSDFWCDFCHRPWSESIPMVEGHHGSIACGNCLSLAYRALVIDDAPDAKPEKGSTTGPTCTLCLEQRTQAMWQSPMFEDAWACLRCVKLAARAVEKDPDFEWRAPEKPAHRAEN